MRVGWLKNYLNNSDYNEPKTMNYNCNSVL